MIVIFPSISNKIAFKPKANNNDTSTTATLKRISNGFVEHSQTAEQGRIFKMKIETVDPTKRIGFKTRCRYFKQQCTSFFKKSQHSFR